MLAWRNLGIVSPGSPVLDLAVPDRDQLLARRRAQAQGRAAGRPRRRRSPTTTTTAMPPPDAARPPITPAGRALQARPGTRARGAVRRASGPRSSSATITTCRTRRPRTCSGCPVGTVKTHVLRGKQKLKARLARLGTGRTTHDDERDRTPRRDVSDDWLDAALAADAAATTATRTSTTTASLRASLAALPRARRRAGVAQAGGDRRSGRCRVGAALALPGAVTDVAREFSGRSAAHPVDRRPGSPARSGVAGACGSRPGRCARRVSRVRSASCRACVTKAPAT